jgi:DNA-binding CsgD family transcriptional regulator
MWAVAAPVVVVEGSGEAFARALAELDRAGWQVLEGFGGRATPGSRGAAALTVRAGAVRTAEDASAALLAVLGGSGIAIHGCAAPEVLDRLLGDLRHLGPVDHRRDRGSVATIPAIDTDALSILGLLAAGRTLGDAATMLGLSRRTADRRLATARAALGAERTAEAVARARAFGLLP